SQAMYHGEAKPEVEQSSAEESGVFSVSIPDSMLSISCNNLVAELWADPKLALFFEWKSIEIENSLSMSTESESCLGMLSA
ncbi:hypothetical protein L3Q82_023724, partial [Scortum barcoo]